MIDSLRCYRCGGISTPYFIMKKLGDECDSYMCFDCLVEELRNIGVIANEV